MERQQRKLAAIMAADVVGYSALMEQDESGTFNRLKAHRQELFEPEIKRHRGRIFKLMGDGLLAEFSSVVDAIQCAIVVQDEMAKRNNAAASGPRIDLRIGITLGDVIAEGKDRHGEGVNIAARLQQLANPGGICVSRAAYDHAKNKFTFEPMGTHRVKNINEPIQAFRVKLDSQPAKGTALRARPSSRSIAAMLAVLVLAGIAIGTMHWLAGTNANIPGKPSIAVLPFDNLSGDDLTGRLANGITEDIITDLSQIAEFDVIARNSTEVYKDKPVDVRQIGRDLDVRYVLEGSIQRQGSDRLRITAQLTGTVDGAHVWSQRWDRPVEDVFAVQTEIAELIVGQFEVTQGPVKAAELAAARRKRPASLTAYDLNLLGVEKQLSPTRESLAESITISGEGGCRRSDLCPCLDQPRLGVLIIHWL